MLGSGRVPTEERKAGDLPNDSEEVTRLSAMVENVLGFARLRDKVGARTLEEVETSAWLREVVERFRHSPAAAGATVVASIPDGLPRLSIDRDAFARAIGNLIDNAVKYSPETKTAWIMRGATREQSRFRCATGASASTKPIVSTCSSDSFTATATPCRRCRAPASA